MYRLANKHVELFKQIPFEQFSADSNFIRKVVSHPEKYGTYENILKVYYFIASEMWDPMNVKPSITNESTKVCFYDFIRKRTDFVKKFNPTEQLTKNRKYLRYKPIKMFNGIFNERNENRHYKRYHGLVAQPKSKSKALKQEAHKLRDMFISYAYIYDNNLKFYKRNDYELPTEWVEHLYELLSKLSECAVFFYKQRGSMLLTQEMISLLSNQFLFVCSSNRINTSKENRQKVMRQIREKKEFMFGELKHDENHYKEVKAKQKALSRASKQKQY